MSNLVYDNTSGCLVLRTMNGGVFPLSPDAANQTTSGAVFSNRLDGMMFTMRSEPTELKAGSDRLDGFMFTMRSEPTELCEPAV
jgi:hypothetical protein